PAGSDSNVSYIEGSNTDPRLSGDCNAQMCHFNRQGMQARRQSMRGEKRLLIERACCRAGVELMRFAIKIQNRDPRESVGRSKPCDAGAVEGDDRLRSFQIREQGTSATT